MNITPEFIPPLIDVRKFYLYIYYTYLGQLSLFPDREWLLVVGIMKKVYNSMKVIDRGTKPMLEKKNQQEGFSLIEILVTVSILGAILISLIGVFIYGFNLISKIKQVSLATQIAQEEVEFIRNLAFDEIGPYTAPDPDFIAENIDPDERYTDYDLTLLRDLQGSLTFDNNLAGLDPNIGKLTVKLTWSYRGNQNIERSIVTYIVRDGINRK